MSVLLLILVDLILLHMLSKLNVLDYSASVSCILCLLESTLKVIFFFFFEKGKRSSTVLVPRK